MADLRKLKDKAAELAARGKLEKAADVYREVLAADPRDAGTLQKLAEVQRRAGRIPAAIECYADLAGRFARDGLLIKAIALCKTILELDPGHRTTQATLAELYGKRAAAEGARPPPRTMMALRAVVPPPPPPPAEVELPEAGPGEELVIERGVAIPLGPPPAPAGSYTPATPIELSEEPLSEDVPLGLDEPAVPAPPIRPAAGPAPAPPSGDGAPGEVTAFSLIVSAAGAAVEAGVVDRIHVDPDLDEEAGPVAGDEPLGEGAAVEVELAAELPDEAVQPLEGASPEAAAPEGAPAPPPRLRPTAPDPRLPRVPIFSDLGRGAFLALTEGMVLRRFQEGEPVLREGELGTSFFVVAAGRFAVTRHDAATGGQVVLAHLGEGEFFGEMALLTGAPRSATVAAEGPAEALELPAELLLAVAGRYPHLVDSLRRFYRQRLLANAMAVSPVFRPFGRTERRALIERFRSREVLAGEVIVREGERSDGLYVVLDGTMDVLKRRGAEELLAGRLGAGDLFGEVSCLRKTAATATVVARRPGSLLRLPRAEFDALVMAYPQILELVSTLSDERLEGLDALVSGHAAFTDEGLVLI